MPRPSRLPFFAAAAFVAGTLPLDGQVTETQSITLNGGWNLIQVQVFPPNPAPSAVFTATTLSNYANFRAVWHFDALTGTWEMYQKPTGTATQQADQTLANTMFGLSTIQAGKAYWVYMTGAGTSTLQVTGSVPLGPTFPSQELQPGWNMLGFPVGGTSIPNNEPISLLAVLTASGFDYDAILTWESGQYRKMLHYEDRPDAPNGLPADATVDPPFPNLSPTLGYWLHVKDAAVLRPVPAISATPDVDVEPVGNYPSQEDKRRSPGNTARGSREQTHITMEEVEDTEIVSISNNGGGIMLWRATWTPSAGSPPGDWISLSSSKTAPLSAAQNSRVMEGVTTVENDPIFLRLDRKNLTKGTYTGTLSIETSVSTQPKNYTVTVNVPGLGGEWSGWAIIDTVNGKRNKVPDIDLNISFSEDPSTPGLLRGAIDSSRSLLWPTDVQLWGHITSSASNRFVLGGSLILPPGDQNNQPYDKFKGDAPLDNLNKPTNDIDWNNNGEVDAINPLPYPIQRSMSLDGRLVKASPVNEQGYEITGTYQEVVYGMLAEPIVLRGTFKIRRDAVQPFNTRMAKLAGNSADSGVESAISKVNTGSVSIPPNTSATRTIAVATDMQLARLSAGFSLSALINSNLIVTLYSPDDPGTPEADPQQIILQDDTAMNRSYLANPQYPDTLTPTDDSKSLAQFIQQVKATKGNWLLEVRNQTGSSITLTSFRLNLVGQPVQDVFVKVQTSGSNPTGVASTVSLSGAPIGLIQNTLADGTVKVSRVPVGPVNFSATVPGLQGLPPVVIPAQRTPMLGVPHDNDEEERMQTRLAGLALPSTMVIPLSGSPVTTVPGSTPAHPLVITLTPPSGSISLYAGPTHGYAPLTVEFNTHDAGTGFAIKLLNMGLGTTTTVSPTETEIELRTPGVYSLVLENESGMVVASTGPIVALQSPNNTLANPVLVDATVTNRVNQNVWCSYVSFHGGGMIRYDDIIYATAVSPKNESGAYFADLTALQHAYSASKDIDLYPFLVDQEEFSADKFTSNFTTYLTRTVNRQTAAEGLGWKDEDYNYTLPLRRWYDPVSHNDIVDGISQLDQNDDLYNASPRPTGETTHYSYFMMTCSVGAPIIPAPPADSFIYPVIRDYIKTTDQPATYGLIPVHQEIPNRADSPLPESGFAATRAQFRLAADPKDLPPPFRDTYLLVGALGPLWEPAPALTP